MNIHANSFVLRQTPESRFSHFSGALSEVIELVRDNFDQATRGYRDGVLLVPVPAANFFSGVVTLREGATLVGNYEARREGEKPRKHTTAVGGEKIAARSVEVVLYSSKLLAEGGDNELPSEEGNWEIISINASPTSEATPIDPMTLLYNHFGMSGGTDTKMTNDELVAALAESVPWWADKAMAG